jgi:hypothetical protein
MDILRKKYKKDYLRYFGVIKESPDEIKYANPEYPNNGETNYHWDSDGNSTFMIYFDEKDKVYHYLSWQYNGFYESKKLSSDSDNVLNDMRSTSEYEMGIKKLKLIPSHYSLLMPLFYTKRCGPVLDDVEVRGRLFIIEGNKPIITFWDYQDGVKRQKKLVEKYLTDLGLSPQETLYQSDTQGNEFLNYKSFFHVASAEMTDYDKEKAKIAQELHVKKAILDKAILNAIASKPKSVNDLYKQLEKQLKMPIVKIRHLFSDLPLDLMVNKALEECLGKLSKK